MENNKTTATGETVVKTDSTYAIPMEPEHYQLVKDAAKKSGLNAASFGRALVLAEAAKVMGVEIPVVVHAKRGPKGGTKHPLAAKFGLSTAVFNRRLAFHVLNGVKNVSKIDFSVDPFAKTETVETTEAPAVDTGATA
jgi:hypothetical protein